MTPSLELALAFHQAVLEDHDAVSATITRLRELTQDADHAYYIDFACFMADLPLPHYRFGCPARGRPAFGVGMTFSPCRSHVLGGGVTGSGGIDRPLIRGMTTGHFRRPGGSS
jgi:hypothetical protein